jgi:hypothetical protein
MSVLATEIIFCHLVMLHCVVIDTGLQQTYMNKVSLELCNLV